MSAAQPMVVYGITAGVSANSLLRGQLAWLRAHGWDVHLAVDPDDRARAAAAREGVTLQPLPMRREIAPLADLMSLVAWIRLLRRLRPDAVNVSTPKAGLLGGLAAAALRVPRRIYVMRGLRVEGARGPLARVLWLLELVSIRVATDVVVVSASLAAEAQERRLLRRGAAWIVGEGSSNGVHAEAVAKRAAAADAPDLRSRLGITPSAVVVGYVGRITSDKGVGTLVEALERITDHRPTLLLVGSLDDEALERRITSSRIDVVHVGWTDDVWSYYAVMDLLCLPTKREGFPNVVLEAGAAGVPTVTTRATGAVDAVVDGVTGLVVPVDDAAALEGALVRLATSPDDRRALGQAARARVCSEFAPESIWSGIDSIMRGQPLPSVRRI